MSEQAKIIYVAKRHPEIEPGPFLGLWEGLMAAAADGALPAVERVAAFAASRQASELAGFGLEESDGGIGMIWSGDGAASLDFVAPLSSTACLTRERVFQDDGSSGVVLVAFVRRRPDLDRSEFSRYWREQHGPLFIEVLGDAVTRYVQNHALDADGAQGRGWDGVVEIGFESAEAMAATFSDPGFARSIQPDEEAFLDMQDKAIVVVASPASLDTACDL